MTALLARQARRGALVVAAVSAGACALVVVQYDSLGLAGSAGALDVLAEDPAVRTLFGPPVALDDPGGFTVWRVGSFLQVLVALWAALVATRLTRGEEEAGRWDLLRGGLLRAPSLVVRVLAVVAAGGAGAGAVTAAALVAAGASPGGSLLFGAVLAGTGAVGAAVGALAAQVVGERRSASGLAVGALLGGVLLRMVADGVEALSSLAWATPFGLLHRAAPFDATASDAGRTAALLVLAALAAAPGVAAVRLSGRRDLGGALVAGRSHRSPRSRLLRSLPGVLVHRTRRPLLVWGVGLGAYCVVVGSTTRSATGLLQDQPVLARAAAEAGFPGLGTVEGFVAALCSVLVVPLGAFAAARVAATAADEAAGRLALVHALPLSRTRWAATEAVVVAVATALLAVVAGLALWLGALLAGAGLPLGAAVAGTTSVLPVALVCLGAALAALGWAPSAVVAVGVLPAAGGFLLLALADSLGWPAAVRGLAPSAHLAAVPVEPWDAVGAAGLVAVALVLAVAGGRRYGHRDLRG
ncbi:hypothetical protein WDV85_04955 [Pseudokineococcus sp. 5B2Z-1]|uniref:hypothetical protein n=1 Tax=Pseudokineococcus sp. 5B2Z-1 TaxID=3132744 RepID=UPI0030971EEE